MHIKGAHRVVVEALFVLLRTKRPKPKIHRRLQSFTPEMRIQNKRLVPLKRSCVLPCHRDDSGAMYGHESVGAFWDIRHLRSRYFFVIALTTVKLSRIQRPNIVVACGASIA